MEPIRNPPTLARGSQCFKKKKKKTRHRNNGSRLLLSLMPELPLNPTSHTEKCDRSIPHKLPLSVFAPHLFHSFLFGESKIVYGRKLTKQDTWYGEFIFRTS